MFFVCISCPDWSVYYKRNCSLQITQKEWPARVESVIRLVMTTTNRRKMTRTSREICFSSHHKNSNISCHYKSNNRLMVAVSFLFFCLLPLFFLSFDYYAVMIFIFFSLWGLVGMKAKGWLSGLDALTVSLSDIVILTSMALERQQRDCPYIFYTDSQGNPS